MDATEKETDLFRFFQTQDLAPRLSKAMGCHGMPWDAMMPWNDQLGTRSCSISAQATSLVSAKIFRMLKPWEFGSKNCPNWNDLDHIGPLDTLKVYVEPALDMFHFRLPRPLPASGFTVRGVSRPLQTR